MPYLLRNISKENILGFSFFSAFAVPWRTIKANTEIEQFTTSLRYDGMVYNVLLLLRNYPKTVCTV